MASRNPDFEGKKSKRGTPTPRRAPGARKAAPKRTKKPFRLEVGKTYENRNRTVRVKITEDLGEAFPYPFHRMRGTLRKGVRVWSRYGEAWHVSGQFHDPASVSNPEKWRDLIREVRQPKAPVARRAKGSRA
jgi:hypothetical protein